MGSLYFLQTVLPELSFEEAPELSLVQAQELAEENLSHRDLLVVLASYHMFDLENVRLWVVGAPMAHIGGISWELLREQLEEGECSVPGVAPFLERYPTRELRREHLPELRALFFEHCPQHPSLLIREFFAMENVGRRLLKYLRESARGLPCSEHLGFDLSDVSQWPEEFAPLAHLWESHHRSPEALEMAIARWKFERLATLSAGSPPFSLERVLTYLLQLRLVEKRASVKEPVPKEMVERMYGASV